MSEKVVGIGGFFFAAADPAALQGWYERHLGVGRPPESYNEPSWQQLGGSTVFAAASADGPHLAGRAFALNFRVADLDSMVTQLRTAGVDVNVDPQHYPNGRFANLVDPEGNPVQLWQPEGPDA